MDKDLFEQFNNLLIQIVAYNTKCKGVLEHLENEVNDLKNQIGKSDTKSIMGELEKIDIKILEEAKEFLTTYTKRNYTEQEIKDLGGHVEQVDDLWKFHTWFKSKFAIFIGVILAIIAITTFGEKITALLKLIGIVGV
jgi:hypothetical protein